MRFSAGFAGMTQLHGVFHRGKAGNQLAKSEISAKRAGPADSCNREDENTYNL
jgi:hypothetical protein